MTLTSPLAAALPDNSGYVAAAYIVFVLLLLIYLSIMAIKLSRIEKETAELVALSDQQLADAPPAADAPKPGEPIFPASQTGKT